MSAWSGVDAAIREAHARSATAQLQIELGFNLFGDGAALTYVSTVDPMNPRRKARRVVPGPIVTDDHSTALRLIADLLDGTIDSLVATDPRDSEDVS